MGRKAKNEKKLKSIVVNLGSLSQTIQLDSKENISDRKDLDKLRKMKRRFKKICKNNEKAQKSPKDSTSIIKFKENTSKNIFQFEEEEMQDFYQELKEESWVFF